MGAGAIGGHHPVLHGGGSVDVHPRVLSRGRQVGRVCRVVRVLGAAVVMHVRIHHGRQVQSWVLNKQTFTKSQNPSSIKLFSKLSSALRISVIQN